MLGRKRGDKKNDAGPETVTQNDAPGTPALQCYTLSMSLSRRSHPSALLELQNIVCFSALYGSLNGLLEPLSVRTYKIFR